MKLALPVALAVLVTEAGAGGTASPSPTPGQNAVAQCAAQVRAATSGSVFGAYIEPQSGNVRSFGSEQEREQFNKCLAQRGASERPASKKPAPN